ncbi:limonene-1,2-epoxide hydrolase [Variovorax paradoxus]|uniref:nuclear transport factor 2 family protein n=1 Tax=Variovorax TaxID=34072 RepID=UPI002786C4E8|nr:nuclear transport factor 2 family protein [Variovorax paradoxus]MDP9927891.1 limonene-1,2-epoxide hydrolase [Variovorax paradoxus]MDQ0027260.1 limonene-1,2-epoxide hydrolase [Variovorax paradoxus]
MTDWDSYQKGDKALNVETAQKWLDQVVAACSTLDPELILDCFTEDAIADLGAVVLEGKEQLRPLIRERYANYTYYDLKKIVRAVSGDLVVCEARLRWKSAEQPRLQHTRAIEILQVRDGRIARWDNASVSWADAEV